MSDELFCIKREKGKGICRGPAGKSFIHVVTLDMYIKTLLSYLVHTNFFDCYIASIIQRYFRYKDREKTVISMINYMCVYDEHRVEYLMQSKFFPRSTIIAFINELAEEARKYLKVSKKEKKTSEDLNYLLTIQTRWGNDTLLLIRNILDTDKAISSIMSLITDYYLRFTVKILLTNRTGDSDPSHLKTDAWFAIMDMLDSYNPSRSKVPFHNLISFYAKNRKDKVIKEETWDLKQGDIVHLGSLEGDNESDNEDISISMSQLQKEINSGLHDQNLSSDRMALLDVLSSSLPKAFNTVIQLTYGIVEPFTVEDEVKMIMSQSVSKQ